MKRIGIITYNWADNYGAILQAFALKKTLGDLGCESKVINYYPHNKEPFNIRQSIKNILFWSWNKSVRKKFDIFRRDFLSLTLPIRREDLPLLNEDFDLFVAGSDQVWNFECNGNGWDTSYMLDFVEEDSKKFSYAASFGKETLSEKEKEKAASLLKDFNAISVREKSALAIIKEITGKDAILHLDPTLLMSKEAWGSMAQTIPQEDYILLYLMNANEKIINYAKSLSRMTGLDIVYVSTHPLTKYGLKPKAPHVMEWLSYFLKAKYVVTNSFHGLAFSINFNKDFFVDLLPPPSNVNSRLENLLELTGLKGRLIDNIGDNYDESISWMQVNKILEEERSKSKEYLEGISLR